MIHIALPCHGRVPLTRCALHAIAQTVREPYLVWVVDTHDIRWLSRGRVRVLIAPSAVAQEPGTVSNGIKLNIVLRSLPDDAEWLFVMHNDAAPLAPAWLPWLRARASLARPVVSFTSSRSVGALYDVAWLRHTRATFAAAPNPGDAVPVPGGAIIVPRAPVPWWLHGGEGCRDEAGQMIYAHLGGGTIGATNRRMPWWLWPAFVRRELWRNALARQLPRDTWHES